MTYPAIVPKRTRRIGHVLLWIRRPSPYRRIIHRLFHLGVFPPSFVLSCPYPKCDTVGYVPRRMGLGDPPRTGACRGDDYKYAGRLSRSSSMSSLFSPPPLVLRTSRLAD